ncbi:MAG TPA: hypothetical protein VFY14_09915 [Streptomyces sp.]|nr:hypothetical protein [Streptomyces sp.]
MTVKKPVPGQITTRAEMKKVFGGGPQGGIIPSRSTPSVLIYVDHHSGAKYGYKDGWLDEEDEIGPVFEYTGAGTKGHQTFEGQKGTGNRAILQHVEAGRELHLFVAAGKMPDSDTKKQRYVGQFELDTAQPYVVRQALDENKVMRKVIVFRLRPAGSVQRDVHDVIPPAKTTVAVPVPADVTTSSMVEPEGHSTATSERSAVPKTQAERREARLSKDFEAYLKALHHQVGRFQIKVKGTTSTLLTDLYDATSHVLYESKGTASRNAVRLAIGQLLDYRRHIRPADPRLAILLPEQPQEDLCELLAKEGIALVYPEGDTFRGVPVD